MTWTIKRISLGPGNVEANGGSEYPVITPDGRYVVFDSPASNLVAGDNNGQFDVFRYDTVSGAATLVSTAAGGTQGNVGSYYGSISSDGRYVAFRSDASNLVANDTNGQIDIFVKDMTTGAISRVSTDSAGAQANLDSAEPVISSDGRYVAFISASSNLVANDTNGTGFNDIFIKDTTTGATTRVSTDSAGGESNDDSQEPHLSADGRYVVFYSEASNLVANDTNSSGDVFLKDTVTGATTRVSTAANGAEANGVSSEASVSADGRYVLFASSASNLVAGDTNGATDIFLKDTQTGAIVRVSTDASGNEANGTSNGYARMSPDARYITFASLASNLVPGDTNGVADFFLKDVSTGAITRLSVSDAGVQGNNLSSGFALGGANVSSNGQAAVFYSNASTLVSGDTNGQADIFLALSNSAPSVTASGGATAASEQTPIVVDSGLTVADSDNTTLASATVSITGNYIPGQDVLAFVNNTLTMGNIVASFDSLTGTLSLVSSGATATLAQWQAALRAVTYTDTSDDPNTSGRTISFVVNDGVDPSTASTKTVSVAAINDAPSFAAGTGKIITPIGSGDDYSYAVAVQTDGKILVGGHYANGSDYDFALVRYTADGSLDTTFSGDGIVALNAGSFGDYAQSIAVQPDGKILMGGVSGSGLALVRWNSNGTLDTGFGAGAGYVTTVVGPGGDLRGSIVLQTDGKILVAGSTFNGGNSYDFALARYNADGSLDATFGSGGTVVTSVGSASDLAKSVAVQSDGKIVVVGEVFDPNGDFGVVRYNADGSLDTTFSGDGKVVTPIGSAADGGYSVAVQSDGKILVGGYSNNGSNDDFALVRYNADGSLDTTFSGDGIVTTPIGSDNESGTSITLQSDGKILVAGLSSNGSASEFALVRYNSDGSLDSSFGVGGKLTTPVGSNDQGYGVALQSDGKIVVTGLISNGSNFDFGAVRYNSDGTLDTRFHVGASTLDGTPSFTEDSSPVALDSNVSIFDADLHTGGNYNGASLTLARHGGASAQDVYSAKSGGNLAALTEGGNLVLSSATIGTVTQNSAGTLILTFNANATEAQVNEAMRDIAYANTSQNPPSSVQIDWSFSDGNSGAQGAGGALAATGSTTVSITAVNDPPVATASDGATVATEQIAIAVDTGLTLSDADNANLVSATVSITGGFQSGQDVLAFTNQNGISGSYDSGTGVLTLSGSSSVANYQTALRSVTYTDTSDTPNTSNRAVSFVVNDGADPSAAAIKTVFVTAVDDAPQATNLSAAESYTEDTALNLIDIVVSDVDSASVTATLTLSDTAAGSLSTATSGAVTSTYVSGTGVWTASGAIADVNALLAGLTFTPSSNFNGNFTIDTSVSDGVAPAVTGSKAMTGIAVEDAPVFSPNSIGLSVTENTTAVTTAHATDVDGDTLTYAIAPGSTDGSLFQIDATSGVLSFKTAPNFENPADSNHDNIYNVTVRASDGSQTSDLIVQVTVTNVDERFQFAQPTYELGNFGTNAGGWTDQDHYPRELADVNGDGRADIVAFGAGGVNVSLATGNGHFATPTYELGNFGLSAGGWTDQDHYPRELADVNGDGKADIVAFGAGGVNVSLATGNGHFAQPTYELGNFGTNAGGWTDQDHYPRLLGDVNGDGKADIVAFGAGGVNVSLATGNGHFAQPTYELGNFGTNAGGWTDQNHYPRLLGDVNGDGMADIVGFGAGGINVSLATGGGHFAAPTFELANFGTAAGGWTDQNLYPRELADVNGDGMADIIGFGAGGVNVSLATGNGHFAQPTYELGNFGANAGGWTDQNHYPRLLADVDGDHRADIVGFAAGGVNVALVHDVLT